MPRSRGAEMPQPQLHQRHSPRAPLQLKTSSESNGDQVHQRRTSLKLEGNHRRSPRSPLHELPAANQKKRGTKVADLETKLGHAKDELRKLKEQLASAEAAKRDAQHELEETKRMIPGAEAEAEAAAADQLEEERHISTQQTQENTQEKIQQKEDEPPTDAPLPVEDAEIKSYSLEETPEEGDVEETHVVAVAEEMAEENNEVIEEEEPKEAAPASQPKEAAPAPVIEEEEPKEAALMRDGSQEENEEMFQEAKLPEEVEAMESSLTDLKRQLSEAEAKAAAAKAREEEMALRLSLAGEELEVAMSMTGQLREQLEAAEAARASLEAEMRKMKVQTEQWRKAAEAAAAVLSGPAEARAPPGAAGERRGSTDERVGGIEFEGGGGGFSGLWSPLAAVEAEDGLGGGRRKGGGGRRVFGDLWRKRGQQHRM